MDIDMYVESITPHYAYCCYKLPNCHAISMELKLVYTGYLVGTSGWHEINIIDHQHNVSVVYSVPKN